MKHEPRDNQRVYITFYLRIFEGDEFIGFLIDIAKNGLKVISDFPITADKSYQLKMKLPSTLEWKGNNDKDRFIEFDADCLWAKHDDIDKDFYLSGFKISDIGEDENKIIHQLIEQYKLK